MQNINLYTDNQCHKKLIICLFPAHYLIAFNQLHNFMMGNCCNSIAKLSWAVAIIKSAAAWPMLVYRRDILRKATVVVEII